MKKRILNIFAASAMLAALMPVMPASAAAVINIGEYVEMGTYYGEPILWRCVDIDENGPLMLSDKIICLKPFDAYGSNTSGSHGRVYDSGYWRKQYGSNYWADSNMRSWLNSNESAGNVTWLCGNPPDNAHVWYNGYADEAGFKTNFTSGELDAVKRVTQDSLLDIYEYGDMSPYGSTYHTFDSSISSVVQNAKTSAYREQVTDDFFLLDVNQINAVYKNSLILGSNYHIGEPTAQAVANSEYKLSSIKTGNKWRFWLRSPYAYGSQGCLVRYVDSGGTVSDSSASEGFYGVRPAFYLNLPSSSFSFGNGTLAAPYKVKGTGGGGASNSTSSGAPVITAASISYNGSTYDLFSRAVNIEEDSTVSADIEAAVNNNGCKNVKVYITQGVGDEIDITGVCKHMQPGKELSAGKTVYIMAVDTDTGRSTSKATKLKITSAASGSFGADSGVDGLNFKLGSDVGFTVPDSVPVFGGTDISWGFDFIPLSVEYDRDDSNKINVVFGTNIVSEKNTKDGVEREYFKDFDFKEYKKDFKKAASKQGRTLKQLRNDFKMTDGVKMKGSMLSKGTGNGGGNIDVAGYAEMKYIDGRWCFVEGQLALNAELKYTYQGQVFILVVPMYYEFGGGVGAGIEGRLTDLDPKGFSPKFEGYLSAKIMAEIGGGVGLAGVATAGASGEGSLNIKTALLREYVKAWGEGSASFNVKLFGKTVAEKEFARGDFLIYETGNSKGLIKDKNAISLQAASDTIYDAIDINGVYENESRGYAKEPTEWTADEPQLAVMSADYTNKDLNRLASNIYTEAKPQICEAGGKKIMVMQWDNTERADADRTMLVYSVYDDISGTWSAPAAVEDDGTADFYPCFRDGYLVWQNEKSTLADDMTLKEIAERGEICAAKWNGSGFDEAVALTDNGTLDTQPCVAAVPGGASVVWTANTEGDILGIAGRNSIMRSDFDGSKWSAPRTVKSGLNSIVNITAGAVDNGFAAAYAVDDDNDLNTINDRDIRIITDNGEIQLTNNDAIDSNPVFADNKIYYYSDGNIMYSDIDGQNARKVFDEAKAGLTDSFVVDSNAGGDTAIWWTKAENGGAEVYASLYNDGAWSDEIRITSVGNKAKYPSGILNDDGSMLVAFNNGIMDGNTIIKTDLYTISVDPSYDIELTDAYFDEGSMTAYATVKNSGELEIPSYTAAFAGNSSIPVTEPLKAGESAEIELAYNKPEDLSPSTIELALSIDGDEYDTDNNKAVFEIGHADIVVENVALNGTETAVSADISNAGYKDAQNVTVSLRDGSAEGAVMEAKTVSLAKGESINIGFDIDKAGMQFMDGTKPLYVTASIDEDEVSLGNNDGYTLIASPSGSADHEVGIMGHNAVDGGYVINSVAGNNTGEDASSMLYTAVYSPDGKLKARNCLEAQISAGDDTGVDIAVDCDIESEDVIKTFMWNETYKPLAKAAEYTVR